MPNDRWSWDATTTLEALGAADVALWLWEPEKDRLRLTGASRARVTKVLRSSRPVRVSRSAAANLTSGAITPAARSPPSSSQTPRQMQICPLRMRKRTAIGEPGS